MKLGSLAKSTDLMFGQRQIATFSEELTVPRNDSDTECLEPTRPADPYNSLVPQRRSCAAQQKKTKGRV